MSSFPTPEKVMVLRDNVMRVAELENLIRERTRVLNSTKEQIASFQQELNTRRNNIKESFVKMDVMYSGNIGWEERMTSMLTELLAPKKT